MNTMGRAEDDIVGDKDRGRDDLVTSERARVGLPVFTSNHIKAQRDSVLLIGEKKFHGV